jgi:hypothetical protein
MSGTAEVAADTVRSTSAAPVMRFIALIAPNRVAA